VLTHPVAELLFLIALYLKSSPCTEAFEVLQRELNEKGLLPTRLDWNWGEHPFSFQEIVSSGFENVFAAVSPHSSLSSQINANPHVNPSCLLDLVGEHIRNSQGNQQLDCSSLLTILSQKPQAAKPLKRNVCKWEQVSYQLDE